jgi:hypothetical protein
VHNYVTFQTVLTGHTTTLTTAEIFMIGCYIAVYCLSLSRGGGEGKNGDMCQGRGRGRSESIQRGTSGEYRCSSLLCHRQRTLKKEQLWGKAHNTYSHGRARKSLLGSELGGEGPGVVHGGVGQVGVQLWVVVVVARREIS